MKLDPNTALIVIDLQEGIRPYCPPHVLTNTLTLISTFRGRNLPVVLVNVEATPPGRNQMPPRTFPPGWTELMPELQVQPSDLCITKRTWGAFTGTGLEGLLRERNITQVLLTGVATSAGVESTARQAHELGFNVALAVDAMADLSPEAHENSLTRIFPKLGEPGTTLEMLEAL